MRRDKLRPIGVEFEVSGIYRESQDPSPAPPGPCQAERRSGQRHMAVLRVAVLVRGDSRQLCLVRNISPGGVMARVFADVEPGERVAIELKAGAGIAGRIAWSRDGNAGIQFEEPVDVGQTLAPAAPRPGWRSRMPRLAVERLAMIRSGADISFASTHDVSQGGAMLTCERPPAKGAEIVLTLEGFRPLEGVVRWRRDDCCGVSFNQVIPPGDLSRWLAS